MIINLLNPIIVQPHSTNMSDEDLVRSYIDSQNINYFNALYDRYSDKIFAKCYSMLKEVNASEDATQEIFMKILVSLSKFNFQSKFSTWVYSVTYNFCIDVIRKNRKNILEYQENWSEKGVIDSEISDHEILEKNVSQLYEVMEVMPTDDKMVLLMKYHDDMSIKEMSLILNKSESAIKMKILRAKERFVKIFDEKYKYLNN